MSTQGTVIAYLKHDRLHLICRAADGSSDREIGRFFPGQLLTAFTAWDPGSWEKEIMKRQEEGRHTTVRETRADHRLYPYVMRQLILGELRVDAAAAGVAPHRRSTGDPAEHGTPSADRDAVITRYRRLQYDYLSWLSWLVDTEEAPPDPASLPPDLDHYLTRSLRCGFDSRPDSEEGGVRPFFYLETLKDLLYLDSLTLWTRRDRLKRCRLCGKFFANLPKRHFAYCPWPDESGVSCRVNGPHRRYRQKINEDPVLLEYRKMYKRGYARQERYLDRTRSSAQSVSELPSFQDWTKSAQELRRRYLRQEISQSGCLEQLAALEEAQKERMSANPGSARHPNP